MSRIVVAVLLLVAGVPPCAAVVVIETVPVGNPGNGPDPTWAHQWQLGAVDYEYRIGKYEVTNAQYAEFLNAKAADDHLRLYVPEMATHLSRGIVREGSPGNFTYHVKPNMADKPVNFVSMYSAMRFANWMHNGQGNGNTESGSYTLLGGSWNPTNSSTVYDRNPGATWVLPTENEWYKAAYHDPRTEAEGGPPGNDHYWLYPTRSDDPPIMATANSVGDISNPGPNVANYGGGADWNGSIGGNVTTIGGAGPESASYYGTYDQGGNMGEWNVRDDHRRAGGLGGAFVWESVDSLLTAPGRSIMSFAGIVASTASHFTGFRLAYVPEPGSVVLAWTGFAALAAWRWKRRR